MNLARITDLPEQRADSPRPSPAHPNDRRMEIVHALMRGRYRWAILLAILLAVPAAWLGYKLGKPIYQSDVPIRVELTERRVLYADEEKAALPRDESFVTTQMALIKSQRVIDLAMQDPGWTQIRKTDGPDATLQFLKNLTVDRADELISVQFDDPDPQAAMAGAEAVVKAYRKLYLDEDAANETAPAGDSSAVGDRAEQRPGEQDAATRFGDRQVRRPRCPPNYRWQIRRAPHAGHETRRHRYPDGIGCADYQAPGSNRLQNGRHRRLGPGRLRRRRPRPRKPASRAGAAAGRIRPPPTRGLGDSNPIVQSSTSKLKYLQKAIQDRMGKLRKMPERSSIFAGKPTDPTLTMDLGVLSQQCASMLAMQQKTKAEYQELDQVAAQTDDLRGQMDEIKKRLEDTAHAN